MAQKWVRCASMNILRHLWVPNKSGNCDYYVLNEDTGLMLRCVQHNQSSALFASLNLFFYIPKYLP
jgi:hypothetical protein